MMNVSYFFRGKRIDDREWSIGCLAHYPSGGCRIFKTSSGGERGPYNDIQDIDPATVGRCAGLKAAKSYRGTKPEDLLVFEGDVARYEKWLFIVRFGTYNENPKNCAAAYKVGWYFEGVGEMEGITEPLYDIDGTAARFPAHVMNSQEGINNLKLEIIGNVWDNPELLEGSMEFLKDDTLDIEIKTLKEKLEREKQPVPLSLEQLKQKRGEPVWVVDFTEGIPDSWQIIDEITQSQIDFGERCGSFAIICYGKTWVAYTQKPKQEK